MECRDTALELIEKNKLKFGCENITVVAGKAPEALEGLPAPDRVFLGGTSGQTEEILTRLVDRSGSFLSLIHILSGNNSGNHVYRRSGG